MSPIQIMRFYGMLANNGTIAQPHFLIDVPSKSEELEYPTEKIVDNDSAIDKLDGKGPARVLLDLLGGPCPIDMNLECLAPTKYPSVSGH